MSAANGNRGPALAASLQLAAESLSRSSREFGARLLLGLAELEEDLVPTEAQRYAGLVPVRCMTTPALFCSHRSPVPEVSRPIAPAPCA